MPFILLAGWLLGVGEANPADIMFQARAAIFLGLGFAFWLAVFPFHSWMPLLTREVHPFPAGFVLSLLPTSVLLLMLDFLNAFGWLRASPQLYGVLLNVGALMAVAGGLFAAAQKEISRLVGYAVIFQTGYALIAIGLNSVEGLLTFAGALLPGLLGVIVFVIALSVLANQDVGFQYADLRGLFRRYPFAAIALLAAYASIGGLPLFAGFPVRQETLELLAEESFLLSAWAAIGSLAFLAGGARLLTVFVTSEQTDWMIFETWPQRILLLTGTVFLVLFGVFPRTFMSAILFILRSFPILLQ
jgi:NADH:ubiquinone oxidoreductase subunit 2 (subunit N)